MIRRFFAPPAHGNEEDNFRARFIHGFSWTIIVLLSLATIPYLFQPATDLTIVVIPGLILLMFVSLFVLHRGNANASGMMIIVLGWLGLGIQALAAGGVKDVIVVGYLALGLLASIIVDWRAGGIVILASIGAIWILALFELNGFITPNDQDIVGYSRDL